MLKLDLHETETGAALVLAAVVAGQVAEDMGLAACVHGLTDSLAVALEGASERHGEVYVAHLEKQLGQGFVVAFAEDGLVTVTLDLTESDEDASDGEDEAIAKVPKKRRGRPPKAKPAAE